MPDPNPWTRVAAETRIHILQEPFCLEIYKNNAGPQSLDTRLVRACAIEPHIHISQQPFCVEIKRKNARPQSFDYLFSTSLRSRNAHKHFTTSILEIYEENSGRKSRARMGTAFCASLSLCSRPAHGYLRMAILY